MKEISVRITLSNEVPMPAGPRPVTDPVHIDCISVEGKDWTWNGSNIGLARSTAAQTVRQTMDALKASWSEGGLRPLRADEFTQINEFADDWPPEWKDLPVGSRIFIPGTEYNLRYTDETFQRIFATRYDHEVQDWLIECEDTCTLLKPGDRFACVHDGDIGTVDSLLFRGMRSYDRRRLFVAHDRPPAIRNRYYPGIEV